MKRHQKGLDKHLWLGALASLFFLSSCVKEKCRFNSDCPEDMICKPDGTCGYECNKDSDCQENFRCAGHRCRPKGQGITCPEDMVAIHDSFCIDRYEASRPDASATSPGTDNSMAMSKPGVLPWIVSSNAEAQSACEAAGKRLCTPQEWEIACKGPKNTIYAYGDKYDPVVCNGIDTFCRCDPYPHCYDDCGADFHLAPTGSFEECKNDWGVYDMNGNVWEHVLGGDGQSVRGGAYNCHDSVTLHRCDYVPRTWTPSALGFRCCKSGDTAIADQIAERGEDVATISEDAVEADAMQGWDIESTDEVSGVSEHGGCIGEEGLDIWSAEEFAGAQDLGSLDSMLDMAEATTIDVWPIPDTIVDTTDTQAKDEAGIEVFDISYDEGASSDIHIDMMFDKDETGWTDLLEISTDFDDVTGEAQDTGNRDGDVVPPCPEDMVLVQLQTGWKFCIDRFEASHSDATATSQGVSPIPASRQGVLPWYPVNYQTAKAACESVSKRLCRIEEWFEACSGPDHTVYSYGNSYNATACNGIDAFCYCDPYPHCYWSCGAYFHVVPTGTFPNCTNEWGVYDMNGNVWEIVESEDGLEHFRGGAYNCGDSEALHRCDYDATWNPSAKGFRCCKDLN